MRYRNQVNTKNKWLREKGIDVNKWTAGVRSMIPAARKKYLK